jgi:hypothetical protein
LYDGADIYQNGLNWENGLSLAADVAGLILPGVTGGGVAVRAAFKLANRADVIGDVANGASKLLGKLDDVAQGVDNAKTLISGKLGEAFESVKKVVAKGCSFSADTLVSTYDGLKPIAWVQTGEQVLAYNEATAATGYYTVTATWNHLDPVVTLLVMDGELIEATPEHPFFAPGVGWREAGKLWPGAPVRKADGGVGIVEAVESVAIEQSMWNLTVAEAHTYFVGDGRWLVHNSCRFGGKTVIQDHSLIDPTKKKFSLFYGRETNVQRMKRGVAPIGPDGKSVNLHHVDQKNKVIQELSATYHQQNYATLHINRGQSKSLINRAIFKIWKGAYWKHRANDFVTPE